MRTENRPLTATDAIRHGGAGTPGGATTRSEQEHRMPDLCIPVDAGARPSVESCERTQSASFNTHRELCAASGQTKSVHARLARPALPAYGQYYM